MGDYTTVKISKDTLRLMDRVQSFFTYRYGKKLTKDQVLRTALLKFDYRLASNLHQTDLSFNEYIKMLEDDVGLSSSEGEWKTFKGVKVWCGPVNKR